MTKKHPKKYKKHSPNCKDRVPKPKCGDGSVQVIQDIYKDNMSNPHFYIFFPSTLLLPVVSQRSLKEDAMHKKRCSYSCSLCMPCMPCLPTHCHSYLVSVVFGAAFTMFFICVVFTFLHAVITTVLRYKHIHGIDFFAQMIENYLLI